MKLAAYAKTFNPKRESHLALFIFVEDRVVLLPFFSVSTNSSFSSLAVSPLIESKELFALSRELSAYWLLRLIKLVVSIRMVLAGPLI
jgi:hypothetical protein